MHIMRPANHPLTFGLIEFVNSLPDKLVMAEIGSYGGESTSHFAKRASKIYCVDPWQTYSEKLPDGSGVFLSDLDSAEAAFNVVAAKYPSIIVKKKGFSVDVAKTFEDGSLDMVYIDANHEYEFVIADIKAWLPKIKKNGIIAGHDYGYKDPHGTRAGVEQAVREMFGEADKIFQDTTWVKQLK